MNTKIFRLILIAYGITDIAAFISAIISHRMLPPELWAYMSSRTLSALTGYERILLYVSCGFVVAAFISYVGQFFWKSWARSLFLLLNIAGLLLIFINPTPVVFTSLSYGFITTNSFLTGIILACAYFNPAITGRFDRKEKAQQGGPGYPPQGVGSPDP